MSDSKLTDLSDFLSESIVPSMSQAEASLINVSDLPKTRRYRRWFIAVIVLVAGVAVLLGGRWQYHKWCERRSKDLARRCRSLRQAKDWTALATVSDQWRKWDSTNADPILFAAEAAQGVEDFQKASDLLNEVPVNSPKRLPALIERTTLMFGPLNQPLEGVRACQQILEIEPHSFLIHQRLIFFYALTLQREKMLEQIQKSMALGSEPLEAYGYLMLADVLTFRNGFELNNRWLSRDVDQEIFLVARTIQLWKMMAAEATPSDETKSKMKLAEQLLSEYLTRFPNNIEVAVFFLDRAVIDGDVDRVEQLLAKYQSQSLTDSRYWRFRGWWHAARDEVQLAENAYRKSLQIYPLGWLVRHELATILRQKRQFEEAALLQKVALEGKAIRQTLMEQPDARAVSKQTLETIRSYARQCGENFVAETLGKRLIQVQN